MIWQMHGNHVRVCIKEASRQPRRVLVAPVPQSFAPRGSEQGLPHRVFSSLQSNALHPEPSLPTLLNSRPMTSLTCQLGHEAEQ